MNNLIKIKQIQNFLDINITIVVLFTLDYCNILLHQMQNKTAVTT